MCHHLELGVNTFFGHFELSALDDCHLLDRFVACSFCHVFNRGHDLVALKHFSKDNVLAIEPAFMTC